MIRAAISAERPPLRQPSSTITARCVRRHRFDDRLVVERAQRTQIDHLGLDLVLGQFRRGRQRLAQGSAVRDELTSVPVVPDRCAVDVDRSRLRGNLAFDVVAAMRARR